jgi:hypothetical protein
MPKPLEVVEHALGQPAGVGVGLHHELTGLLLPGTAFRDRSVALKAADLG